MKTASRRLAPELLGPRHPGGSPAPLVGTDREGSESRLWIEGAFDALTVAEINPVFEAVVAARPSRVTVDLDKVPLMDSTGVTAMVSLWKRIKAQGGSVVVVRAKDQPLTILKVLALDVVFGLS